MKKIIIVNQRNHRVLGKIYHHDSMPDHPSHGKPNKHHEQHDHRNEWGYNDDEDETIDDDEMFELKKKLKEKGEKYFHIGVDYMQYILHYGSHFNKDLAKWACSQMVNKIEIEQGRSVDEPPLHSWSAKEVMAAFEKLGLKCDESRIYDAQYHANMCYADYFPHSVKTEVDCIKNAYDAISDPDGYPGAIFNRWLSDYIGQGDLDEIDFKRYI